MADSSMEHGEKKIGKLKFSQMNDLRSIGLGVRSFIRHDPMHCWSQPGNALNAHCSNKFVDLTSQIQSRQVMDTE